LGFPVPGRVAGGFVPVAGFAALFDSGFLALKTPAPTSTPTSCPNTVAPVARLKQSAADIKTAARRIALVLIILSLVLFGLRKMQLMDP
jgi:hypothetical protein